MWEAIKENLSAFFNMPVVITITGVLASGAVLLGIFAKTSFGKKALIHAEAKVIATQNQFDNLKTAWEAQKADLERKTEELVKLYEAKLSVLTSEVLKAEELLNNVAAIIPNKKVKALILDYVEQAKGRYQDILEAIPTLEQVEELKKEVEEQKALALKAKDEAIKEAKDRLEALETEYRAKIAEAEGLIGQINLEALQGVVEGEHE